MVTVSRTIFSTNRLLFSKICIALILGATSINVDAFSDESYEAAAIPTTSAEIDGLAGFEGHAGQVAPFFSRVSDLLARGACVAACEFVNFVANPSQQLKLDWKQALPIALIAGSESGFFQFVHEAYQKYLTDRKIAPFLAAILKKHINVNNVVTDEALDTTEGLARAYTADFGYLLVFNIGVVYFAPEHIPTLEVFFEKTAWLALLGTGAQGVQEIANAFQVRAAKVVNPGSEELIQQSANKVAKYWSIVSTLAVTGSVFDMPFSQTTAYTLAFLGVANYVYNLFQRYKGNHRNLAELLHRREAALTRSQKKLSCWQSFMAPFYW